jgi:hypothetical protein
MLHSATLFYPTSCRRPLTDSTQKTLELQNPVPKTIGRLNRGAGMSGYDHSCGECNWWPVSRNQPLDTTITQEISHGNGLTNA